MKTKEIYIVLKTRNDIYTGSTLTQVVGTSFSKGVAKVLMVNAVDKAFPDDGNAGNEPAWNEDFTECRFSVRKCASTEETVDYLFAVVRSVHSDPGLDGRYALVTWPESQAFVGNEDCILVCPPEDDTDGALDSAYMVPVELAGVNPVTDEETFIHVDQEDYPADDAECYRDYDGGLFVPVSRKTDNES